MGCPARPTRKSFFGFTYKSELSHDWVVSAVTNRDFETWETIDRCSFCGRLKVRYPLSDDAVIRRFGFLPDTGVHGSLMKYELDAQAKAKGIEYGNKS